MNEEQLEANIRQQARMHPHGLPAKEMLDSGGRCLWCIDRTALADARLELQEAKDSLDAFGGLGAFDEWHEDGCESMLALAEGGSVDCQPRCENARVALKADMEEK